MTFKTKLSPYCIDKITLVRAKNGKTESLSNVKSRTNADIIINGGTYSMETGKPQSYVCIDGKTLATGYCGYGYGISGNAMMWDYCNSLKLNDFIGAYGLLVVDGKVKINLTENTGKRERTAIGLTANDELVIYCTTEGIDYAPLADKLIDMGCQTAINLDGGGSTQWHSPKGDYSSGRAVSWWICIYLTEEGKREFEIGTVHKMIDIATAEIGYLEKASNKDLDDKTANAGKNNYTKYGRDTAAWGLYNGNKNGYAWCDQFFDWCMVKAFNEDVKSAMAAIYQPMGKEGAGCGYSMSYYKNNGAFYVTPKAGDQIFFSDNDGGVQHTGLVYDTNDKYVYTIEGNTSSTEGVVANGGCVAKKHYELNHKLILGYGRPRYADNNESEDYVEVKSFKNGNATTVVYQDTMKQTTASGRTDGVGTLGSGVTVDCLGVTGNFALVRYIVTATGAKKVGYVEAARGKVI